MAHASRMNCKFPWIWAVHAMALAIAAQPLFAQGAPSSLPRVGLGLTRELIYSDNPNDPWNKIFYFLFSRELQVRLSSDFAEGAPFRDGPGGRKVSTRVFERNEAGDRAIDPMYPTFSVALGSMLVLSDSAYPAFTQTLRDALKETITRSVSARALMQSDLWGAYDALFFPFLPDDERRLGERRKAALDLTGRLIGKIALTPDEINALPENYSSAVRRYSFPDVFAKDSGWIEVAWFLPRSHDYAAGFRRVSRVFLKPGHSPRDVHRFLKAQANTPDDPSSLEGVALMTQLLLIDSHGNLRPTRLTSEAQVRIFSAGAGSGTGKGTMRACEISRKLFLQDPDSGGLAVEEENTPAYLSNGGSYGFAEGLFMSSQPMSEPIEVKLRTRCAVCHGENLAQIRTFSVAQPPNPPEIRQLNPASNVVANIDISIKRKEKELQALLEYFKGTHP
jgi:hypothetical protein